MFIEINLVKTKWLLTFAKHHNYDTVKHILDCFGSMHESIKGARAHTIGLKSTYLNMWFR